MWWYSSDTSVDLVNHSKWTVNRWLRLLFSISICSNFAHENDSTAKRPEIHSPVRAFSSELNTQIEMSADPEVDRVRWRWCLACSTRLEILLTSEPVSDSIIAVDLFHLCTNERDKCEENSEPLRTGNVDRLNVLIKRLERASENGPCHTLSWLGSDWNNSSLSHAVILITVCLYMQRQVIKRPNKWYANICTDGRIDCQ